MYYRVPSIVQCWILRSLPRIGGKTVFRDNEPHGSQGCVFEAEKRPDAVLFGMSESISYPIPDIDETVDSSLARWHY